MVSLSLLHHDNHQFDKWVYGLDYNLRFRIFSFYIKISKKNFSALKIKNTCSIKKILTKKNYAGKLRSIYKFDIEDLSLSISNLNKVTPKNNELTCWDYDILLGQQIWRNCKTNCLTKDNESRNLNFFWIC